MAMWIGTEVDVQRSVSTTIGHKEITVDYTPRNGGYWRVHRVDHSTQGSGWLFSTTIFSYLCEELRRRLGEDNVAGLIHRLEILFPGSAIQKTRHEPRGQLDDWGITVIGD
jgi:hypothetical protein